MKKKTKSNLPIVEDITKYELQMEYDARMKKLVPVKNTYVEKKTGEIVKIDWRDGEFRLI